MKRIPVVLNLVAILILALVLVSVTWLASRADTQAQADTITTLQAENIQLHSLLNESETKRAELTTLVDWVDESGWRSGYRDACIQVAGLTPDDCWSLASAVARSQ